MKPDLTHGQAVSWSLGVMLAFVIAVQNVALFVPSLAHDLVLGVGIQVAVYLSACALFSARRPGRSFEDLFALRRAPVLLLVTALALGLALRAPIDFLQGAMEKVAPMPKEAHDHLAALLVPRNRVHAVALATVVGVLGPVVEELLYRGALFTGLRSAAGVVSASVTTSLLFTLVHAEPRFWPPLFLLACCLAALRAASGSLWPGVLLHGAFNGTAVVMAFSAGKADALLQRPAILVSSTVVSVLLFGVFFKLARGNSIAERARSLDGQPAPAPEAMS